MKQHFGTCGAFGAKVLAPLLVASAAAAGTAPPSGALATAEDSPPGSGNDAAADNIAVFADENDGCVRQPDEDGAGVDDDDGSSVLRGLQMDDEAQLLTWKVCERRGGEVAGGGRCKFEEEKAGRTEAICVARQASGEGRRGSLLHHIGSDVS